MSTGRWSFPPHRDSTARAASHRRRTSEVASERASRQRACRPSWLELPFRALLSPWPGIPGLLSWGWPATDGCPPETCPPPLHRHHRRASTPGDRSHRRFGSDQLPNPVPSSWFLATSTVSSARRLAGLLRPAAGPGVRRVSDREIGFPIANPPRRRDHPSKNTARPQP
jgi:hypothetical protein